jgi:hypothetical protein
VSTSAPILRCAECGFPIHRLIRNGKPEPVDPLCFCCRNQITLNPKEPKEPKGNG